MSQMSCPLIDVVLNNMETSELEVLLETMESMDKKAGALGKQDCKIGAMKNVFAQRSNVAKLPATVSSNPTIIDDSSSKKRPVIERQDSQLSTSSEGPSLKKAKKSPVWRKPIDKPKRPLSAYNIFFHHERTRIVRGQPLGSPNRMGFSVMAQRIAAKWKKLDTNQRSGYTELAKKEKEKYVEAVRQWKLEKERQGEKEILAMKMKKCCDALNRASALIKPDMFDNISSHSEHENTVNTVTVKSDIFDNIHSHAGHWKTENVMAVVSPGMSPEVEPNKPARTPSDNSTFNKIEGKVSLPPFQSESTPSKILHGVKACANVVKTIEGNKHGQLKESSEKDGLSLHNGKDDSSEKEEEEDNAIFEPLDAQLELNQKLWKSLDGESVDFLLSLDFSS